MTSTLARFQDLIKIPQSIALFSGAVAAIGLPASIHTLEENLSHKQFLRRYWTLHFFLIHFYSLYQLLQPLSPGTALVAIGTLVDFFIFVQFQKLVGQMTIPQLGIAGMVFEVIQKIVHAEEEEGSPAVTSQTKTQPTPLLPTSMPTTSTNPLFISLSPDEVAPPPYDSSSASVVKS
ncbi:hypothetical protein K435DRAFT_794276 [Dendrothele bispora CBS 962.96]|uniref:Uncharacterized protein n=1 Tax=Dendrothele bispora (strain CBS 962.96) TaxID=1314807 RepID=A0A4S8MD43_DENBC|nr:hypothetical protein K435DRAFT_794276 [Dendrothele bispora CBS 962.96]